jgi:hypothetical protein
MAVLPRLVGVREKKKKKKKTAPEECQGLQVDNFPKRGRIPEIEDSM